jgi:hypothetical protein
MKNNGLPETQPTFHSFAGIRLRPTGCLFHHHRGARSQMFVWRNCQWGYADE